MLSYFPPYDYILRSDSEEFVTIERKIVEERQCILSDDITRAGGLGFYNYLKLDDHQDLVNAAVDILTWSDLGAEIAALPILPGLPEIPPIEKIPKNEDTESAAGAPVLCLNHDHEIISMNEDCEDFLGLRFEKIKGRKVQDVLWDERMRTALTEINAAVEDDSSLRSIFEYSIFRVEATATRVRENSKDLTRFVFGVTEILPEKKILTK